MSSAPQRPVIPFFRRSNHSYSTISSASSTSRLDEDDYSSSSSSASFSSDDQATQDENAYSSDSSVLTRRSYTSSTSTTTSEEDVIFPGHYPRTTSLSAALFTLPANAPRSTAHQPHLKLSLALLRTRQAITALLPSERTPASGSYETLSQALKTLSASLSSPMTGHTATLLTSSVLVPILDRLVGDLRELLSMEELNSREKRRTLRKDEAKCLVGLKQRWGTSVGKGKEKERDKEDGLEWVQIVQDRVSKSPPPLPLPPDPRSTLLLNAIESLLLPSSLPRISLSNLGLTDSDLESWDLLKRAPEVVRWYKSFEGNSSAGGGGEMKEEEEDLIGEARDILRSVKSLDLSKNKLSTLPTFLPRLFPSLESLSLAHNAFVFLPSHITLFPHLRRLRIHDNPLRRIVNEDYMEAGGKGKRKKLRSNGRKVERALRDGWQNTGSAAEGKAKERDEKVSSLMEVCVGILREDPTFMFTLSPSNTSFDNGTNTDSPTTSRPSTPSSSTSSSTSTLSIPPSLPHHLLSLLLKSYTCSSCHRLTTPLSPHFLATPIIEKLLHITPGISLPKQLNWSPPTSLSHAQQGQNQADLLTLEERILLALIARGGMGGGSRGGGTSGGGGGRGNGGGTDDYFLLQGQYCRRFECAWAHLGLSLYDGDAIEGGREVDGGYFDFEADERGIEREVRWCGCLICKEERRVRGYTGEEKGNVGEGGGREASAGGERVLRWLRRLEGCRISLEKRKKGERLLAHLGRTD